MSQKLVFVLVILASQALGLFLEEVEEKHLLATAYNDKYFLEAIAV